MFRFIYVGAFIVLLMLAVGCTDRGTNPDRPEPLDSGLEVRQHRVLWDELVVQVGNTTNQLPFTAYWPDTGYFATGDPGDPIPLLILLAPEGSGEYFYLHHGLQGIADRLLADGEIDPMAVVMFANRSVFGGYFYAGDKSNGAGQWDKIIGDALIDYLEYRYSADIHLADPGKRGIGGIGQGAYGAYRAAIINPNVFGSVSGVDGPLDFDGPNGDGGLVRLMDTVFAEQPNLTAETFRRSPPTGFDTSQAYPVSRMFAGGGMAFSPMYFNIDSFITYTVMADSQSIRNLRVNSTWRDSSYQCLNWDTVIVGNDTTVTCTDSLLVVDTIPLLQPEYAMVDEDGNPLYPNFLIDSIVTQDAFSLHFHLPFGWDESGVLQKPYQPIWSMWMAENLDSLLLDGGSLEGIDLWLGTSPEARWAYNEMTESWISFLQTQGYSPTVYRYTGYDERPATNHQYVYDLLEQMLKFHSASFKD